ncbi:MAG: MFS transporter [Muribaculaceae bacterium]|nr:MFS transporter [Muribaculaceae bacterium]
MTQQVRQLLNDRPAVRWTALILLALAMFFGYMFVDVLSPLQTALQDTKNWDPETYGRFAGSETFLNVFIFFLIFAGIILDKMGVRFTAILSGSVMLVGAFINYYALTPGFEGSGLEHFFANNLNLPKEWWNVTPFFDGMPASAKMSAVGFMLFGCGIEMAGITVSRGIVKWFEGKEMALAMGIEMALARVGVAAVFALSPLFCKMGGVIQVSRSAGFVVLLLIIGLISFITYAFMDKKLENQIGNTEEKDDPFKISDLKYIFSSKVFWIVAILCVLYYSAIFPFQKYAGNMLQCNLGISTEKAALIFTVFPLGAAAITPFLGNYLDRKGKGASMLILGALLMIICHLTFAVGLPALRGNDLAKVDAENSIITATFTDTQADADGNYRSISVVFNPGHFTDKSQADLLAGLEPGQEALINPRQAFGGVADAEAAEASAQKIANLLTDKDVSIDLNEARELNRDFSVKIEKIQAPMGGIGVFITFLAIILLGISFSLVPASLWPSVPKLIDGRLLGSAYAVIFWIQNIGLYAVPMIIGGVLAASNVGVSNPLNYNYTVPMLIFASFGVLALLFGLVLKAIDRKHHYGLELPNKKQDDAKVEFDGME